MSGMLANLPEGRHAAPARGALAGARGDHKATKDGKYDPRNAGTAWSHNFLNQKPWHPSNFKNQARAYEAEQEAINIAKRNAIAKSEFEAEQYQMENLSFLSPEDRQKHMATAQIAFMYQKPPGMDSVEKAAAAKEEAAKNVPNGGAFGNGRPGKAVRSNPGGSVRPDKGHLQNMLASVAALGQSENFELKPGMSSQIGRRSPTRGKQHSNAGNQRFLVTDSDEDRPDPQDLKHQAKLLLKQEKQNKRDRKRKDLEAAEAFLRSAGVDPDEVAPSSQQKHSKKSKRKKHKH